MSGPRVHVLGLGSIGTFAAHVLADARPQPLITLLLHRPGLLDDYARNGRAICLRSLAGDRLSRTGYRLEVLRGDKWLEMATRDPGTADTELLRQSRSFADTVFDDAREASSIIDHLVVAVKSWQTVDALAPLKHRLSAQSSVLFIQNGSGMLEAVNEKLFPDPKSRPRFTIGITTQCINLLSPFNIEHAAMGHTSMGMVPREESNFTGNDSNIQVRNKGRGLNADKSVEESYLMRALSSVPVLNAKPYSYTDILQLKLEKLTINAVNNPICALADAKNEYLWQARNYWHELVREISAVAQNLPELRGVPGVAERFSADRLQQVVLNNLRATAGGTCSMVWDLRANRKTEVRFINGYWMKRGEELGLPTPLNAELVSQIEERGRV